MRNFLFFISLGLVGGSCEFYVHYGSNNHFEIKFYFSIDLCKSQAL